MLFRAVDWRSVLPNFVNLKCDISLPENQQYEHKRALYRRDSVLTAEIVFNYSASDLYFARTRLR